MKGSVFAAVIAASMIPAAGWAGPLTYTIEAGARISQFNNYVTQSFTGSDEVVASLPSVSASAISAAGNSMAAASATTQQLTANFSTRNSGINTPGAFASSQDLGLIFQDNSAFRSLFGSNSTYKLLLNFDFSYTAQTNTNLGIFAQATSFETFAIRATSDDVDSEGVNGGIQVINFPFQHTVTATGALAGLTEGSGQKRISVPLDISRDSPTIIWNARVDVSGLALSAGFSDGSATLTLPDLPFLVTTFEGTPLSNLGVQFDLIPRTTQGPGPGPGQVPEPASAALLGSGLAMVGASRLRRLILTRQRS